MIKLLNLIEEKINLFLIKIINFLSVFLKTLFHRVIPKKIFIKIEELQKKLLENKEKIKLKSAQISASISLQVKNINNTKEKIKNVKKNAVAQISFFVETIRNRKSDDPTHNLKNEKNKNFFSLLFKKLLAPINKILHWLGAIRPSILLPTLLTLIIGSISIISIMKHTNRILVKSGIKVLPVSTEIELKRRPAYYKAEKKYLVMINIFIPVYASNTNKYQTLSVDIQLVTSIRMTKEYISKHQTLIRDKLNMTFEPIIPEFPLTVEGRAVLKDKIKIEINNFLQEQNVPGIVEEVVITNIFTS